MARAAILPPSPVKRGARTAPRSNAAKTGAGAGGSKAKSTAKKGAMTTATRMPTADVDSTDDELGLMMMDSAPAMKTARPRGRPPGRGNTKTASTRAKKSPAVADEVHEESEEEEDVEEKVENPEPVKRRVGRPRKNQPAEKASAAKTDSAPNPRGRPKGSTNKTTTTRKTTRKAAETGDVGQDEEPKHLVIATNSTTMRSNILRGPAKKKTVTFQDVSDSGEDDGEERPVTAGRGKASTKGAGKTGLGATPVRRAATGRGRKPAAAKQTSQPLSPKKDKQMARTLSAYASSDGEEDELSAAKVYPKSPVKLVVHSPAKPSENTGLSSPVRKINFTPKKASNVVDENGDPKLPTPKHGSSTGLSSPVRKINFTPQRHHAVADNGHLALPPGKSIDFSDSVFMSSPARRPEASPFQFTLKDTPNRGLANSIPAPNLTPGRTSSLKASPKKGQLGASFSGSPSKSTAPAFPARSSLLQSPAKKVASPFKSSLFSSKESNRGTAHNPVGSPVVSSQSAVPPVKPSPVQETAVDEDIEMVEEVARDIFGIELYSDSKTSESPLSTESLHQPAPDAETASVSDSSNAADVEEKLEQLEEEIRREPHDMGTVCFGDMEELQKPFQNLDRSDLDGDMQLDENDQAEQAFDEQHSPETTVVLRESSEAREPDEVPAPTGMASLEDSLPTFSPPPPEMTLGFTTLEELHSPAFTHEAQENVDADVLQFSSQQPDGEDAASEEGEEDDVDDDELTLVQSEVTFTTPSRIRSPGTSDLREDDALQAHLIPPSAPTPVRDTTPAGETNDLHTRQPDSGRTIDRLFDINYEPRMDVEEDSLFETTQSEIPTPSAPCASNTPSVRSQRKSIGIDLEFTPLAHQFGGWDTNTPSQDRSARPRRRGVFSLVGPLDKSKESETYDAGDVSYPDLSRRSLANTPRLFAELPQSDVISRTPESDSAARSPLEEKDFDMEGSPTRSEIFEDPEPAAPGTEASMQAVSYPDIASGNEQDVEEDEDKENNDTPSLILPTTPVRAIAEHRTVHTVSKVPLKGEGEVSPLKLPRKRGLSLSSKSPTRSSPRTRRSPYRAGSAPAFSPHKAPRRTRSPSAERSPSPKRRCSTPRLSSGKMPSMAPQGSSPVVPSPAKAPRRGAGQQTLRGAVVHVDVHTTEGEDASGIFVELLQQMGARCVKSWSWNPRLSLSPVDGVDPKETNAKVGITHIVYKDGGLRTLEKVKHAAGLVKCVGVGWVLDCERENKWLDESPYMVDSSIIPRGGAKRRKSMEPRALSNVNGTLVHTAEPATPSASGRRCGADWGAMESFRKITPPVQVPATPEQSSSSADRFQFPQTPGYNFANLDAIGMSPATPYFLSNRAQLVQQSCPPKQSQQGLFPVSTSMASLFGDDDEDERSKQRARMEAARRKTNFFKPSVGSPLKR